MDIRKKIRKPHLSYEKKMDILKYLGRNPSR